MRIVFSFMMFMIYQNIQLLHKVPLLPKFLTSDLPVSVSLKLCLASREKYLLDKPVGFSGGYQQACSGQGTALLHLPLHCFRLLLGVCSFEG